jgi:hypothetical protein
MVICQNLLEGLSKPPANIICLDSWFSGLGLNMGPPQYKARVLSFQLWRSIHTSKHLLSEVESRYSEDLNWQISNEYEQDNA